MNLQESLYYRAKSFVKTRDFNSLIQKNNLSNIALTVEATEMIETCETIKNYIKSADTLLDIGTHNGMFTKVSNAFFNFNKTVCFEPNNKKNAIIQKINSALNITIENIALSDKDGEVEFFLHEDDAMNSLVEADKNILRDEFPWDNPDKMTSTKVKTTTLDNYVETNFNKGEVFFLKIDTQGNEQSVLGSGINTLKRTEICLIEYMFFSPYKTDNNFSEFIEFMHRNGFDCRGALTISKRISKKISAVDFLFVKR